MPLPMSKSALDRLGNRLAQSGTVADSDLNELANVVSAYQDQLNEVEQLLRDQGYAATTRVKTTGTLVEKLQREHGMRLSQVQDLAGARITLSDREAQEAARADLVALFESRGYAFKVVDRRATPSHGYRAVHVIVTIDRIPVEIQLRTGLQDAWAQIVERLADRWGRGIRYGEAPQSPDSTIGSGDVQITRQAAIEGLTTLSDEIARYEEARQTTSAAQEVLRELEESIRSIEEAGGGRLAGAAVRSATGQLYHGAQARGYTDLVEALEGWERMSDAEVLTALRRACEPMQRLLDEATARQDSWEATLRGTLQLIAQATEQG